MFASAGSDAVQFSACLVPAQVLSAVDRSQLMGEPTFSEFSLK